jgi:hypothetical protein
MVSSIMDSSLLSIIGTIVQAYASILGIIGMYIVFLRQRKTDQIRDLSTRLKTKSDSLIDFINREIAPAYSNAPIIRVDSQRFDEVLEAIDQYQSERKREIPDVSMEDVKRLLILWTIMQKEKEELVQLNNELLAHLKKPVIHKRSSIFFVGYFMFTLFFCFLGFFLIFAEHDLQYLITQLAIMLAIIGLFPLGTLLYNIR